MWWGEGETWGRGQNEGVYSGFWLGGLGVVVAFARRSVWGEGKMVSALCHVALEAPVEDGVPTRWCNRTIQRNYRLESGDQR